METTIDLPVEFIKQYTVFTSFFLFSVYCILTLSLQIKIKNELDESKDWALYYAVTFIFVTFIIIMWRWV